jgi:lactate dehydrogenase-like 2-hydroxyacid dehydrogenase
MTPDRTPSDAEPIDLYAACRLPDDLLDGLSARFRIQRGEGGDDPGALDEGLRRRVCAIVCAASILSDGPPARLDAGFLSHFPNLRIVANLGVGYEQIDAAWAGAHGIVVTNTPDVLTDEVADLAMGLLLATIREIPQADRFLREGRWANGPYRLTASLRGRKLGVLGLGRIGKAIAARAQSFGLSVGYHGRSAQPVAMPYFQGVLDLARWSDILMVAAPGGPQTRAMIDAQALAALGPGGVLINIARGSLVDEAALVEALRTGAIAAAGLDVFETEPNPSPDLLSLDNVVLLPHVGSGSRATRAAMARLVVDNLLSWAQGSGPLTPVAETPWRGAAKE